MPPFLVRKEQMRTKQEEKKVRQEGKTDFASKAAMGPVRGGARSAPFFVLKDLKRAVQAAQWRPRPKPTVLCI